MKPEDNTPASVKLQEDYERLVWRLWCVTVALIVVGALCWGGILVVNTPRSDPAGVSRFAADAPPDAVPPVEDVQAPESLRAPLPAAAVATAAPATVGGTGIVWVNTHTKVYHYPGYRWYEHTIQGKYVSEEDAIAEGDRAAKNERRPVSIYATPQP